jgi:hypothetical protein
MRNVEKPIIAALSYPSPSRGGWPAEGWSGGGSHNGSLLCGYPHPGLRFAIADAKHRRPNKNGGLKAAYATLPARGRDHSASSTSLEVALLQAGRG